MDALTPYTWQTARLEGKPNPLSSRLRQAPSCSLEAGALPWSSRVSQLRNHIFQRLWEGPDDPSPPSQVRRGQHKAQNGHLAYLDAFPSSPQTQLSDAKLLSFICFIPTMLPRLPGPGGTAPAGLTGWAAVAALSLPEGSYVSPAPLLQLHPPPQGQCSAAGTLPQLGLC